MSKFFVVFKFELNRQLKSKPFVILTLVMMILIAGVLSYPNIKENLFDFGNIGNDDVKIIGIDNESSYDVDNIIQMLKKDLPDYEYEQVDETVDNAKQLVIDEEYEYIIIINDVDSFSMVTKPAGINDNASNIINNVFLTKYRTYLMTESGVDQVEAINILYSQVQANIIETGKSQTNSFFYTYILIFLLYMTIIIYGQLIATNVASEKSSRAMEVLITTVNPIKMLFGKVIGTGCAALSQLFLVLGTGILFYNINSEYWGMNEIVDMIFNIPTQTIVISAILFVLGFFVYAFLYAAIGSWASRLEDINSSILPITFISVGSFMVVFFSMISGNPDSTLMKICSYFPLTSPYALLARASMTDMPIIESIVSIGILTITSIIIGYLAALIYKMGVLLYGKPPKIIEIFRLIKRER